jgi:large subunit ribosomal protein L3
MSFILGRKIGMSQIFKDDGTVIPVSVVQAGPVYVVQTKNLEKDGYMAVQVGFEKSKKTNKAISGHLKKANLENLKTLKEFRVEEKNDSEHEFKTGDKIDVSAFEIGAIVKVKGIAKSKGFQGVVKRHGFKGSPASHGHHKVLRRPGSIGQRFPQHTLKGTRMGGRMGGNYSTSRNLEVVMIDAEKNIMAISGAVPGRKGTLLEIQTQ